MSNNLKIRIGHGFDVHKFGAERPLILAGIEIPHHCGLLAHSDGDVILHAITDAILGAVALGDIGKLFPDTDMAYKNMDSAILLQKAYAEVKNLGYTVSNLDVTVMLQQPKLRNFIDKMRDNVAKILELEVFDVSIKATTTEKLGFVGRGEGIACESVVLLQK